MATHISHSAAETEALGETWGRIATSGLVVGLSGELGAGKTQLVKGFARGLGITQRVHSPTFTLVNVYCGGRLTLFHLDFYRLDQREQILGAGLEEYFHPAGVTVIEWAERWFGKVLGRRSEVRELQSPITSHQSPIARLPERFRRVLIEDLGETARRITYEDFGH